MRRKGILYYLQKWSPELIKPYVNKSYLTSFKFKFLLILFFIFFFFLILLIKDYNRREELAKKTYLIAKFSEYQNQNLLVIFNQIKEDYSNKLTRINDSNLIKMLELTSKASNIIEDRYFNLLKKIDIYNSKRLQKDLNEIKEELADSNYEKDLKGFGIISYKLNENMKNTELSKERDLSYEVNRLKNLLNKKDELHNNEIEALKKKYNAIIKWYREKDFISKGNNKKQKK